MLTYSALPTSNLSSSDDKTSKTTKSVGFSDVKTMRFDEQQRKRQLKLADEYIQEAYDLVWKKKNCESAINVLKKALQIQKFYHGKHHKDVGWSYSFIGTAYWQSGNDQESLTFLLEARRIFCKSGKGRLKGVDRKICNILVKAGLNKIEIKKYKEDLEDTIKREIQGDYYKKQGNLKLAKEEFRKAKDISSSLMNIFVLDS